MYHIPFQSSLSLNSINQGEDTRCRTIAITGSPALRVTTLEPVPAIYLAIFITCLWVLMCIISFYPLHWTAAMQNPLANWLGSVDESVTFL